MDTLTTPRRFLVVGVPFYTLNGVRLYDSGLHEGQTVTSVGRPDYDGDLAVKTARGAVSAVSTSCLVEVDAEGYPVVHDVELIEDELGAALAPLALVILLGAL